MRHVILTCTNHDHLRWTCKEIAFSDGGGYDGTRNIFYWGSDPECSCSRRDLVRAPEDAEVLVSILVNGVWVGVRQDSDVLARYEAACAAHKVQRDVGRSRIFRSGGSLKSRMDAMHDLDETMPFSFAG